MGARRDAINDDAETFLRDFVTPGVPGSGVHEPVKSEGLTAFDTIGEQLEDVESDLDLRLDAVEARYVSTGQTIAAGTSLDLAHGLGAEPRGVTLILQCLTAEHGYDVGWRVVISPSQLKVRITSTHFLLRFAAEATAFTYMPWAHSSGTVALTDANWELYVIAWR